MLLPTQDLDEIASSTSIPWRDLDGAHLFVTGATGFWGAWLLESFAHARKVHGLDAHLTFLSRDPEAFLATRPHLASGDASKYLSGVRGDVRDFPTGGQEFSHVIHAATPASAAFNESQPLEMFSTIVDGTRRILELCQKSNASRLLLASSGAVYGPQPSEMTHVEEDFAGSLSLNDIRAAYAQGKRASEWLANAHAQSVQPDLEVVTARGWAFVGPLLPLDTHFAIGNFLRDALHIAPGAQGDIHISGDGTPFRSYLYASEMAEGLWAMLLRGASGRAYNLGSEDGRPLREVAEVVARVANEKDGRAREVRVAREPDVSKPASRYVPSTRRAREELGLRQKITLEEGVRRTLVWLNP
jgi:dTDP-glucose 4,6-dehydratase